MIVADVNLVAHLILGGAGYDGARRVLEQDAEWSAPLLWRSEFRSVLSTAMRHGGRSLAAALRAEQLAARLLKDREFLVAGPEVLRLSAESRCSAYDLEYVTLARQLGVTLVTSDRQVLTAFPGLAVSPTQFVLEGRA